MDTLTLIRQLIDKDSSLADDLIDAFNSYARGIDVFEYGLPMHDPHMDAMRLIVLRWLLDVEKKSKAVA